MGAQIVRTITSQPIMKHCIAALLVIAAMAVISGHAKQQVQWGVDPRDSSLWASVHNDAGAELGQGGQRRQVTPLVEDADTVVQEAGTEDNANADMQQVREQAVKPVLNQVVLDREAKIPSLVLPVEM